MKTKILAVSIFSLSLLGLTAIPAFAAGSTVSQVYTVNLTAPATLGLTLTPPPTSSFSTTLTSSGLSSQTEIFNASANGAVLTDSGNTPGTITASVAVPSSLSLVAVGTTPSANQVTIQTQTDSTTAPGGNFQFSSSGVSVSSSPANTLSAGQAESVYPDIVLGAGTAAGNYSFTFSYTIA
jgi:hypothetical protein